MAEVDGEGDDGAREALAREIRGAAVQTWEALAATSRREQGKRGRAEDRQRREERGKR